MGSLQLCIPVGSNRQYAVNPDRLLFGRGRHGRRRCLLRLRQRPRRPQRHLRCLAHRCWLRPPDHHLWSPSLCLCRCLLRLWTRSCLRTRPCLRPWRRCPPRCPTSFSHRSAQGLHGLVGHYYGKRSAEPFYGYYGHGVGIYNNNVYSGFHGNHYANGLPGRSFAAVTRGKRSAEAEAEAFYGYGHQSTVYGARPYVYGKRSADAEAEADPFYGYGYGLGYHGYHHGGYYGHGFGHGYGYGYYG